MFGVRSSAQYNSALQSNEAVNWAGSKVVTNKFQK